MRWAAECGLAERRDQNLQNLAEMAGSNDKDSRKQCERLQLQ